MTDICGAILSRCVCHRERHDDSTPHRCGEPSQYDENGCGGSWFGGEDDLDGLRIVSYPFANWR